jgi:hypothetical protein
MMQQMQSITSRFIIILEVKLITVLCLPVIFYFIFEKKNEHVNY